MSIKEKFTKNNKFDKTQFERYCHESYYLHLKQNQIDITAVNQLSPGVKDAFLMDFVDGNQQMLLLPDYESSHCQRQQFALSDSVQSSDAWLNTVAYPKINNLKFNAISVYAYQNGHETIKGHNYLSEAIQEARFKLAERGDLANIRSDSKLCLLVTPETYRRLKIHDTYNVEKRSIWRDMLIYKVDADCLGDYQAIIVDSSIMLQQPRVKLKLHGKSMTIAVDYDPYIAPDCNVAIQAIRFEGAEVNPTVYQMPFNFDSLDDSVYHQRDKGPGYYKTPKRPGDLYRCTTPVASHAAARAGMQFVKALQ